LWEILENAIVHLTYCGLQNVSNMMTIRPEWQSAFKNLRHTMFSGFYFKLNRFCILSSTDGSLMLLCGLYMTK
jgi:hypothetical protein